MNYRPTQQYVHAGTFLSKKRKRSSIFGYNLYFPNR